MKSTLEERIEHIQGRTLKRRLEQQEKVGSGRGRGQIGSDVTEVCLVLKKKGELIKGTL